MAKKKKDNKKHLVVEKPEKLAHCFGKKCNRFLLFKESCPIDNCFLLSEEEKKKYSIENLAKILSEIYKD